MKIFENVKPRVGKAFMPCHKSRSTGLRVPTIGHKSPIYPWKRNENMEVKTQTYKSLISLFARI
jgi:hypothetical protein